MDLSGGEGEDENVEVKDDKEVNQGEDPAQVPFIAPLAQVPTVEPILVPTSNSIAADDLDFLEVQIVIE